MDQKTLSPEEKKVLDQKLSDFQSDLKQVCEKHKLDLIPALQYAEHGIIPVLRVMPMLDKEEKQTEDLTKS